ncbi:N-acyl-phosphatidylethanolamine-hydrolyzing phospholipase D 1-like [Ruditapes philippinarum]|uniref:N-acyl-phosphatidylethanolamine-hydrolyzing phospholipase D 1-like n=1 Tax=Ruditapes philippinarum TaxID=129788 RepID=UPI00295B5C91|nr:N-acyl-phosphatidylethanolamine-hydrolyzing phospholipase D 1-like [Ruditapes philippinarum]
MFYVLLKLHNLWKLRYYHNTSFSLSERLSSSRLQVVSFGSFQDVVLKIDGLIILFDPFDRTEIKHQYFRYLDFNIIDSIHNFELDVVALSACACSFSYSIVSKIVQKNRNVKWIIPLERKDWLIRQGVDETSITVFGFWDEKTFNIQHRDISVVCTPTHRNSVSSGSKMCNTCGWIVKGSTRTFYSAGFTNYNATNFSRVKERYGPIHLTLLPLSNTSGSMSCSPEFSVGIDEILDMHNILQPCTSLGIVTTETRDYWYQRSMVKVLERKHC